MRKRKENYALSQKLIILSEQQEHKSSTEAKEGSYQKLTNEKIVNFPRQRNILRKMFGYDS